MALKYYDRLFKPSITSTRVESYFLYGKPRSKIFIKVPTELKMIELKLYLKKSIFNKLKKKSQSLILSQTLWVDVKSFVLLFKQYQLHRNILFLNDER